jgi:hypothetical protein
MIDLAHDADLTARFLTASLTLAGSLLAYRSSCRSAILVAAHSYSAADRDAIQALTRAIENLKLTPARPAPTADPTAPVYRPSKGAHSPSLGVGAKPEPSMGEVLDELEDRLEELIPGWTIARCSSPREDPIGDMALADGALALPSTGCGARKGIPGAPSAAGDAVLEKASLRRARPGAGEGDGDQRSYRGESPPGAYVAHTSAASSKQALIDEQGSLCRPARRKPPSASSAQTAQNLTRPRSQTPTR